MLVAIKSYFLVDGESGSAEIDLKGVNKIGANRWFVLQIVTVTFCFFIFLCLTLFFLAHIFLTSILVRCSRYSVTRSGLTMYFSENASILSLSPHLMFPSTKSLHNCARGWKSPGALLRTGILPTER